jgi:Ethanolamine utilization protein EutJ (predicted chaperonin)
VSSLAATLREAEPGIKVRLVLEDGSEVACVLRGVDGDVVELDGGATPIDLGLVKRVNLDFSSAPKPELAA